MRHSFSVDPTTASLPSPRPPAIRVGSERRVHASRDSALHQQHVYPPLTQMSSMASTRKKKPAQGHSPRGRKGQPRDRLARAAGFASDAQLRGLFPEPRQKPLSRFLNSLTELLSQPASPSDEGLAAIAPAYGALIRALAQAPAAPSKPERSSKDQNLALESLKESILSSIGTALVMLPSILSDEDLTEQQKLAKLSIYTSSMEDLYEPLQLSAIGEPGEAASFHPAEHQSRDVLKKGDPCVIKQIGLAKAGQVIRKAVVKATGES